MANNDPIKDYNPARLKLDNIKEKMEMYFDGDDPITDLHDCSNDLSDEGSRKEEYEHAKFAEKKRQNATRGYNSYNYNTKKITSNKLSIKWIVIIILIFMFPNLCIGIIMSLGIFLCNSFMEFSDTENQKYTESTQYVESMEENSNDLFEEGNIIFDFSIYKNNIILNNLKTPENETYICLNNLNDKSFSNFKIESVFYDEKGMIIYSTSKYVDLIMNNNIHFMKVINAPKEYARCEHNIVEDGVQYSDVKKENFILKIEDTAVNSNPKITLEHYLEKDINYAAVYVAYIKEDQLLEIEEYHFWDLEPGVTKERILNLDAIQEKNISDYMQIVTVNEVEMTWF